MTKDAPKQSVLFAQNKDLIILTKCDELNDRCYLIKWK